MNAKYLDDKLKILLVMPAIRKTKSMYDKLLMKLTLWKPLTLHQIAACSRGNIKIVDENYEKIEYSKEYDLVGISTFTSTAPRAYKIADKFREIGTKVILGGYHPTALPEEAKMHADSVVIGNAEGIWENVLKDVAKNNLKPFYISPPLNENKIPSPVRRKKSFIAGIEATRGCPYRCKFCSISNSPIGFRYTKKPIEQVIKEIESVGKNFIFYDSSLTIDISYTKELFRRLIPLNKRFACFGNVNALTRNDELLKMAQQAGCVAWAVGMEAVSQETLDAIGKRNDAKRYKEMVKKVKDYGMSVIASLVFGFDNEDASVFENTLDRLYEIGVDSIGVNILTPFPGTPLFDEFNSEGRIITYDWEKYDLYHVVYMPKRMSVEELYYGTRWIANQFFSFRNIFKKFFDDELPTIPKFSLLYHLITSRMVYMNEFNVKDQIKVRNELYHNSKYREKEIFTTQ